MIVSPRRVKLSSPPAMAPEGSFKVAGDEPPRFFSDANAGIMQTQKYLKKRIPKTSRIRIFYYPSIRAQIESERSNISTPSDSS